MIGSTAIAQGLDELRQAERDAHTNICVRCDTDYDKTL
jgi:hypothetical protein